MAALGFDIRAWRKRLELSQDDAARELGVSRSHIQNLERGSVGKRKVAVDRRTELACRQIESERTGTRE